MVEIRSYRDGDQEEILQLFKRCFGHEMSYNKWVWKYGKSPHGSVSYVAVDNNKVISHCGGVKFYISYNGRIFRAYQLCDAMTAPEYRAKIFSKEPLIAKLYNKLLIENDMDFAFGFPALRNARLLSITAVFSQYSRVTLFRKYLSVRNTGNTTVSKSYMLKVGWEKIDRDRLDELWERYSRMLPMSILKGKEYLSWRYVEDPSNYYSCLTLQDVLEDKIMGFAAVTCMNSEMKIMDIIVDNVKVVPDFWRLLEFYAIKMQSNVISVWINSKEYMSKYLIECGYDIIEDVPVSVKVSDKSEIKDFEFYDEYCYRMGDAL